MNSTNSGWLDWSGVSKLWNYNTNQTEVAFISFYHFIHNAANIWPLPLSYGIGIITEVYTHLFAFQPCHKYLLCGKILLCKSYIDEHECTHMSGSDKKCYVCGLEIRYGREYHNCQAAPVMPEICGDSCRSLSVHSKNCDINEFQLNILFYCVCF